MILIKRLKKSRFEWIFTSSIETNHTLSNLIYALSAYIEKKDKKVVSLIKPYLFIYYEIGGYQGGNCWDDTTPQYVNISHKEVQLHELFLELTGFQLQELKVETFEFSESEYYGNSTDYKAIMISVEDIKNLYQKYNLRPII